MPLGLMQATAQGPFSLLDHLVCYVMTINHAVPLWQCTQFRILSAHVIAALNVL